MADTPETKRTWQIPDRLRLELLAALSSQPDQVDTMTYEEFLEWADEDTHAEWVEGRVEMPSPVSLRHQQIKNFLYALLSRFAMLHDAGTVADGPFQMKLARTGREPDLLFVAKAHLARLKGTYLDGPADIAIEIISPESGPRDRGEKYYEYAEAGVPEYWLIDPTIQQAIFYQLDTQGHYQQANTDDAGRYASQTLPGFWLMPRWLWEDPLPDAVATLLEIDKDAYTRYLKAQLDQAGT